MTLREAIIRRPLVRDALMLVVGGLFYFALTSLQDGMGVGTAVQAGFWTAGMGVFLTIFRVAAPTAPGRPRTMGDRIFATRAPVWLAAVSSAVLYVCALVLVWLAATAKHPLHLWGYVVAGLVVIGLATWSSGAALWKYRACRVQPRRGRSRTY